MNAIWKSIVKPPYAGLPWLIWIYVVFAALMLPHGGVFTGHLIGFDDQVRMTQVLNWVNGAAFYDRTIARVNAPEGFTTIWSRLVDIPIALVVIVAQQFVPQKSAALIAAAIVPLAELAILFAAAPYFARPLIGKRKARLILLFLMFTSIMNVKHFSVSGFLIGEASHHPYYIVLNLTMLGAIARLAMGSLRAEPVLMLGGSVALLMSVGIESFPLIAGGAAILALTAWGCNRPLLSLRGSAGFLYGALGGLILLPMHQPPDKLFMISFAEPSIFGPILVAVAGLFLKIEHEVLKRWGRRKIPSALFLGVVAFVVAALLIVAFPRILDGAAAGLSPAERRMALSEHFEALPVYALARDAVELICLVAPSIIALAAGIFAVAHARGRRRAVAFSYLGFAVVGTGMSELFSRFYHHAMTTACPWLLWLWERFKKSLRRNIHYSLLAFASFVALGPFWMLLLPAINNNAPIGPHVLLFPALMQTATDPCDSLSLADYIDDHYSKDTLVDVPYWQSAQFLYQTDVHIDFLANYPSQDKYIDNYAFFGTRDGEQARQIAARHGIDLVVACRAPYLFNPGVPADRQVFMARLQSGHVPAWLKPVETPGIDTNYLLYAVDKAAVIRPEAQ